MNENSVLEIIQCHTLRLWRQIRVKVLLDSGLSSCLTLGILLSKLLALVSWSPLFILSCPLELVMGEESPLVWLFQIFVLASVVDAPMPQPEPHSGMGDFSPQLPVVLPDNNLFRICLISLPPGIPHPLADKNHLINPLEARPLLILAPESPWDR